MIQLIVTIFVVGYLCIALESFTKVNKAGIALLMGTLCWASIQIWGEPVSSSQFHEYLAEVCETILFLMGAMTVVETVDRHGGFRFVNRQLYTANPKVLLWKVVGMTFILSALLDNMTTSIVMTMILRNLILDREMRLKYVGMVILAANAGGAFSPIGDVTTIMLWIRGCLSTTGVITGLIIPSIVCAVVPALFIMPTLKGKIEKPQIVESANGHEFSQFGRHLILLLGVGGLIFVPFFHNITDLPPFMGVLFVLSLLWVAIEVIISVSHGHEEEQFEKARVTHMLSRIDMSTILFFLGILTAVNAMAYIGVLDSLGKWLETSVGNVYVIDSLIGVFSSVIDNVPLVASAMGMYEIAQTGMYAQDGLFWELLAYCAGTGGSLLIIGSAAGVVVMGIEKISFIWYLKKFTLLALVGYVAGIAAYWLQHMLIG